ncbi:MarR family winged helix-turn-helix transcriptional regulator [Leucobacter albus]|uniref:MarR family winged helix-turn-helix transcriptional regulator n=1 Tax=Leucobacter albus TaxID=272210 RepID=A0ABW3TK58_9MICO
MTSLSPTAQPGPAHAALALELVRSSARLTRSASKIPGVTYSSIAWRVLADLERHGPARITELAAAQRVAQPTMTALVQRLEGEGWVQREPDPADGRATLATVTPAGRAALAGYRAGAAALIAPKLVDLSAADLAALGRAAELMHQIADST